MPRERFDAWLLSTHEDYVASRIESGETEIQARENADRSFAANFPGGELLATHRVFDVLDGDEPVGYLWIGPQPNRPDAWWVFDVEILPALRGKGFGRQAMLLGESEARRLGATSIGLNVFGYNTNARGLYESLGYEATAIQMSKSLTPAL
ncbi:GNAT family N-acetyltransferase [Cryobacterium sp. PH31-AA6]|uniref:GNAT family N-acetyltransferase n=1 Tax=Cryobacterium sp. PH31-AA6 TaxID=3046205 RepID=UPI0024B88D1E|nr:GNAT family N-acetyltransferase [Cryobacterium sp. PH31-AA6]MDJ0323803.1 GNAT family N-acetyltransferase [Cryobacterium sp. PH31-AA6]